MEVKTCNSTYSRRSLFFLVHILLHSSVTVGSTSDVSIVNSSITDESDLNSVNSSILSFKATTDPDVNTVNSSVMFNSTALPDVNSVNSSTIMLNSINDVTTVNSSAIFNSTALPDVNSVNSSTMMLNSINDVITVNSSIMFFSEKPDVNNSMEFTLNATSYVNAVNSSMLLSMVTTIGLGASDLASNGSSLLSLLPSDCKIDTHNLTYIPWANSKNIVSLATFILVSKSVHGFLVPFFGLVGLVTNALNVLVFYRQGLRVRVNMLLFSLSVCDFVVEVYMFVIAQEGMWTLFVGKFFPYGPVTSYLINHFFGILLAFAYPSGFTTALIAVERCVATTRPFLAQTLMKTRTMAVVVVVFSSILLGLHYFSTNKFRLYCVYFASLGVVTKNFYPSDYYVEHMALMDFMDGILYGLVFPILFTTTTTIATIITAISLKSAARFRRGQSRGQVQKNQDGGGSNKEVAVTKTLIAVSCLFILCTLPAITARIMPMLFEDMKLGGRYHNTYMVGTLLVHLAAALNSSLNFFFYFYMGSKFRDTFYGLFGCASGSGGKGVKGLSNGESIRRSVASTISKDRIDN